MRDISTNAECQQRYILNINSYFKLEIGNWYYLKYEKYICKVFAMKTGFLINKKQNEQSKKHANFWNCSKAHFALKILFNYSFVWYVQQFIL